MMNFNHGSGFDAVSTPGFEAFTVSFSANYFDSVARSLGLSVPDQIYQPLVGSVSQSAYTNAKLRKALINLMDYQRLLLDDDSETELVTHLIDAFTNVRGKNDIPPLPVRSRSIAAAMEFIEENRLEAITVKNICEATGTSIRTLERAFKERFGIPPKSYIKRRRLTGVKAELLSLEGYISITDVANSWGFWHMGQFARDYRTVFGELPSETVRRNGSQPDIYSQFP
ncbi:MAG: helix-turn-helix domain-containing protein [Gammaproteobacteria bacterium]|nr:helix-turn-helix domain-containing protein [Gammaproteobacteria bacterium]